MTKLSIEKWFKPEPIEKQLFGAIAFNDMPKILALIKLLKQDKRLDSLMMHESSPLAIAIIYENIELVKILLESKHVDVVKLMLDVSYKLNSLAYRFDSLGNFDFSVKHSALSLAIKSGNLDIVKYLIKYAYNLNSPEFVTLAFVLGELEIARLLIHKRFRIEINQILRGSLSQDFPHVEDDSYYNAKTLEFLDELGLFVFDRTGSPAHFIYYSYDLDIIKFLVRKGEIFDPNTIITKICEYSNQYTVEILEFFKKLGAKVTDRALSTLIREIDQDYFLISEHGLKTGFGQRLAKIFDFFLRSGVVPVKEFFDKKPFILRDERIVELFRQSCEKLDLEAIINLLNLFGDILLPVCDEGLFNALDKIEDFDIQARNGKTILHLSIDIKRPDITNVLISKIASYNIKDYESNTAIKLLDTVHDLDLQDKFKQAFGKGNSLHAQALRDVFTKIFYLPNHNAKKLLQSVDNLFGYIAEYLGGNELKRLISFDNKSPLKIINELENDGLVIHDVLADGNCFFHVIAANTDFTHEEIRMGAINHILQNIENFAGFTEGNIDYYISRMSKDCTWADNMIIQAVANNFGLNIEILRADNHEEMVTITPVNRTAVTQHIIAMYTGDHYMAGYRVAEQVDLLQLELVNNEANLTDVQELLVIPDTNHILSGLSGMESASAI